MFIIFINLALDRHIIHQFSNAMYGGGDRDFNDVVVKVALK